ncbi:recombinase family protein [Candidatus Woesearchaeota archaeon]|nr:recombinase family protein [Candidatus Woesearchaeota archaeon]
MKAALYIRVSTDKQASEGSSLEVQEEKLRKYCSFQNWDIFQLYADRGISGKDTERLQFQTLMKDAREKRFEVVVVAKLDRFGRSLRDLINTIWDLNAIGIQFTSINDNINTTTPNGKLLFHILGAFAEFEREIIRERMMAGIAKSRELGRIIGRVPMGYKVVNKKVCFDPEKAPRVKGIFNAYAAGETIWKISNQLQMKPSTVSYILKNQFYAEPRKNGTHEALVGKDLFDAIQPALQTTRRPYQPITPLVTNLNSTVNASPCV